MKKALIAMSGGVDSSVAALLMQQKGYECVGATMKLFENEQAGVKREKTCCSLDDVEDARSVAYRLHMPYYVFNFTANFEKEVMDRFVHAYENGWTPNPCIDCNRYLKFEKLYLRMQEMQMDTIVTGHYARVAYDETSGRYLLKKGLDGSKDQSYVLYNLTQEQLAHTQFPVGELSKHRVREIAEEHGFLNADKPDSQDICFVPDGDYAAFLERYTGQPMQPGNFVDEQGHVIGRHKGAARYTIGQRKGLGIGGRRESLFILATDVEQNVIYVGEGDAHPGLWRPALHIAPGDVHWVNPARAMAPGESRRFRVRIRYRQPLQEAWLFMRGNGVYLLFDTPQRGITPGQFAAWYDGDELVGSGVIEA